MSSWSLAWAISLATIIFPVRSRGVATGYLFKIARISSIGLSRFICTASNLFPSGSGRYRAGSVSSLSKKIPSRVIFALMFLWALQLTPRPMGQDAPCRGSRTTLMSWQKYFPPNCAPIPSSRDIFSNCASSFMSLKACPSLFPFSGRVSRYPAEASLTVFRFASAEVPPTTKARW